MGERETRDFKEHWATALFGGVSVTVKERNETSETVRVTPMELNGHGTE